MNTTQWGYINDMDESLQAQGGTIRFGLNRLARITALAYVPPIDGGQQHVQMEVTLEGGSKVRQRVYMPDGDVYSGGRILSPGMEGYERAVQEQVNQRLAVLIHAVRALGATPEQIQANIQAVAPQSFEQWCRAVLGGVSQQLMESRRVDVFLEYEWSVRPGQTQTYLTLPRNMKGGAWLCPSPVGTFHEVRDEGGLRYVNDEGAQHPFTRSADYMQSNKANQQRLDAGATPAALPNPGSTAGAGTSVSGPSTW